MKQKINHRYAIVGLLPEDNSSAVEFIQKRYESARWRITFPPHMTILRPSTGLVLPEDAMHDFASMTLSLTPPRVVASTLGMFLGPENTNVAYIEVAQDDNITALHQTVVSQSGSFCEVNSEYKEFVPHITLANHMADRDAIDQLADEVGDDIPKIDFVLDRVHLFQKSDQDRNWVWLAEKLIG